MSDWLADSVQSLGTILTRASCTGHEPLSLLLAISNASDAERNHTRQCRLALWFVGKLDHMLVDHD
jgi:hypothetical protein